jgi:hypothetical protein
MVLRLSIPDRARWSAASTSAAIPESFQLESQSTRLYANVPAALQVIAADRAPLRVTGHWTVTAQANYPMALDEPGGRLFVGCRRPAHLVMLDTASGRAVGSTAIVGDTDDLFYDRTLQRLYVIGGEGSSTWSSATATRCNGLAVWPRAMERARASGCPARAASISPCRRAAANLLKFAFSIGRTNR